MGIRSRQEGVGLAETVVALALAAVVLGVVFGVAARLQQGTASGVSRAATATTAAGLEAEITDTVADAAAKMRYYDHAATIARVRAVLGGGGQGGPGGKPPKEGKEKEDKGGTGSGKPVGVPPHEVVVAPVFRVGDGLLWRAGGRDLEIAGPAAVWEEGALGAGEQGQSLTVLRASAATTPFALGAPLWTAGESIRLVAPEGDDAAAIEALGLGSRLLVVGRDGNESVRCVLVELLEAPMRVAALSPSRADGQPVFAHFEARCRFPVEPLADSGLSNRKEVRDGIRLSADASVTLLDEVAPVVTYFTRRGGDGVLRLVRQVGAIGEGEAEELSGDLVEAMRIETALAPEAPGLTEADRLQSIEVSFALRGEMGVGQPVRAMVEVRAGAYRLAETELYWDVVSGGSGGGGK